MSLPRHTRPASTGMKGNPPEGPQSHIPPSPVGQEKSRVAVPGRAGPGPECIGEPRLLRRSPEPPVSRSVASIRTATVQRLAAPPQWEWQMLQTCPQPHPQPEASFVQPTGMEKRLKMLYLLRLVPLAEQNYNLVELGPRETGKSFAYQQLSPYAILLTGPTTVANLFYNIASGKMGLVGLWDAVAFDEVADLQKMPKEVVTTLKTYCESGTFARGKEQLSGTASIAMFGNTNQPVEVMVRSSHLFAPMPDVIREDTAFLDRIHFYIPGWEIPKMQMAMFTRGYGFVVDYLAEALREMRRRNYTEIIDRDFGLGSQLKSRDVKAVRKTVAGLVKLLHPHGEVAKEELRELLELAMEGRRRVKEQLKKLGSFEFFQTSFSYIDKETGEERYVGVPEEGGRNVIASDPLEPGSVYAASVDDQGKVGLCRIEIGCATGTGKLKLAGGIEGAMKESIQRAFGYL